ncbi:MAG: hypothetical protein C0459_05305 [Chitinophaga sp.]|jgi:hypothetical protein|nr:hypothetical protein [Chitinophaga sp.]
MDKFKQHLQQNRTELDSKEPAADLWLNIQQQLPAKKMATVITIFKWAAAACVVVLCGFGVLYLLSNGKPKNDVAVKQNQSITQPSDAQKETTTQQDNENNNPQQLAENNASTDNISTQKNNRRSTDKQPQTLTNNETETTLQSLESSFINIINLQKAKISATPLYTEGPGYYNDFVARFKDMDNDEQIVKKAIAKQGLTDNLLSRLINIYQQKLNVLKALQTEINKTNSRYMQNRQPSDSTNQTTFIHFNNI